MATRLAELYRNLQAQTWRQEFTEVAMGHSPAAAAFYQAIGSFERVMAGWTGDARRARATWRALSMEQRCGFRARGA